jgi:hypothetical protein
MKTTNHTTKTLLGALCFGALLAAPVASEARAYVDVRIAPPPARYEAVPAPRRGYVWAPGYWNWDGHRHVWAQGHYVRSRGADYRWVPHRWEHHDGHYRLERGRWERGRWDSGHNDPRRRDHGQ